MPISKSQIETWSKYQQLDILKQTYDNINQSLSKFTLPNGKVINTYLQGSYGNSTHIYGKGDIDVVVKIKDQFYSNLSPNIKLSLINATYNPTDFFEDLYVHLKQYCSVDIVEKGTKTIKISHKDGKKAVDVVACFEYRLYENPNSIYSNYIEGVTLKNGVINYPKLHKENGEIKMKNTNSMFKSYIRMFKNINKKLNTDNPEVNKWIPSYFIECLLYNLPDHLFETDLYSGFDKILDYLLDSNLQFNNFMCQNKILYLFGTESTQWSVEECKLFISKIKKLCEN